MLPFRGGLPRIRLRIHPNVARTCAPPPLARLIRRSLQKSLQQRCYAHRPPSVKPSRIEEELKRQARAAVKDGKKYELPERLIIYHAGTGRTTFLAMVKVTTLFLGAFFGGIMAPSYYKAGKPEWQVASVAVCGFIPILFVAYITAPFVTHIHIHLPPYARASRAILARFVRALPPATTLTLTTMSFIAKPRYSHLAAGDLVPTRQRFGVINYVRDTAAENARRRWYNYRAVGKFYVQEGGLESKRDVRRVRYEKNKKKDMVDAWIWEAIKEKLGKKHQTGVSGSV